MLSLVTKSTLVRQVEQHLWDTLSIDENTPDGKIDDSAAATLLLTYVSHNINWEDSIIFDYEDDLQKNDNRCSVHKDITKMFIWQ